jgi:hypothetical protein
VEQEDKIISDKIILVIAIIIGIAVGFGIGYLTKAVIDKVKIATLEKERDQALLAKQTMKEQWEKAINELNQTKVLLTDTLAALELLKKYQAVDNETRNKIKELEKTLDPQNKPTEDTYDKFRKLVEEMNKKNQAYNTALVASIKENPDGTITLDLQPFIDLEKDAEKLFNEATNLLMQYKGK